MADMRWYWEELSGSGWSPVAAHDKPRIVAGRIRRLSGEQGPEARALHRISAWHAHLPLAELHRAYGPTARELPPLEPVTLDGSRWRHAKSGGIYKAITGRIEATLEPVVVCASEADGAVWVLPHAEFTDGRFVCLDLEREPA